MNNMKLIILPMLLIILLIPKIFLFAQEAVVKFESDKWLQTWLLCGPFELEQLPESLSEIEHLPGFETDFLKQTGGESG